VYAREGNGVVIALVDPLRRVASRLPWWLTKYGLAAPLAFPYYLYAKLLRALPRWRWLRRAPLHDYSLWIAEREFAFFRHVAFDQLVTPRTVYIARSRGRGVAGRPARRGGERLHHHEKRQLVEVRRRQSK
jgi:hypothetical protein